MTSYLVYRDCPGKQRQYIRRISHQWAVWNEDITQAQRFSRKDAEQWALMMSRRSTGYDRTRGVSEAPGVYDTTEVKP